MNPDIKIYNIGDFFTEDEYNNFLIELYVGLKEIEENKNKSLPPNAIFGETVTFTLTPEHYL